METKKKKKSGVDYLREKVAKLEEENAQLKREITRLLSQELERTNELEILKIKVKNRDTSLVNSEKKVAKLNADLVSAEERLKSALIENESYAGQLLEHMGWFRRWTWKIKHGAI